MIREPQHEREAVLVRFQSTRGRSTLRPYRVRAARGRARRVCGATAKALCNPHYGPLGPCQVELTLYTLRVEGGKGGSW